MKRLYSEYSIRFDPPDGHDVNFLMFTAVVTIPKTKCENCDVSKAVEMAMTLLREAGVDPNYIGPWAVEEIEEQYLMSVEEYTFE